MSSNPDRDNHQKKRDERIQIVVPDHAPWPPRQPEPQSEPEPQPFEQQPFEQQPEPCGQPEDKG